MIQKSTQLQDILKRASERAADTEKRLVCERAGRNRLFTAMKSICNLAVACGQQSIYESAALALDESSAAVGYPSHMPSWGAALKKAGVVAPAVECHDPLPSSTNYEDSTNFELWVRDKTRAMSQSIRRLEQRVSDIEEDNEPPCSCGSSECEH